MENRKVALSYSELREKYREHAGQRFDTAVAVSPDGKRIRNADFVVVYRKGERRGVMFYHYSGIIFHQNKLALDSCKVIQEPDGLLPTSKEQLLKEFVIEPGRLIRLLASAAPKTQVALRIGKLSVLIVEISAVPDMLKSALALLTPPGEALMYLINKAKKPSGEEGQSSSDEPASELYDDPSRCSGPGTISYCAPFDESPKDGTPLEPETPEPEDIQPETLIDRTGKDELEESQGPSSWDKLDDKTGKR